MNIRKLKLKLKVLFSSFHLNGQLNGQISSTILKVGTAYHTYIMSSVYRTLGVKKVVRNNQIRIKSMKAKESIKHEFYFTDYTVTSFYYKER